MRIWDIDPGYLNRGSLLAEHREIHSLFNVITKVLPGFESQGEHGRWQDHIPALVARHHWLVCEMALRGIGHHSPLPKKTAIQWPELFLDEPDCQFDILSRRYQHKPAGRIPFPKNCGELWAQHKYSVMARDPALAKELGKQVAQSAFSLNQLASLLIAQLRNRPGSGRLKNALDHMWGYVNFDGERPPVSQKALMLEIQKRAFAQGRTYLISATSLGELARFTAGPVENE